MALRLPTASTTTTRSQKFPNENALGSKMSAAGSGHMGKKDAAAAEQAGGQLARPNRRAPLACLSNKIEPLTGTVTYTVLYSGRRK